MIIDRIENIGKYDCLCARFRQVASPGIWLSYPVSDVLSFLLSAYMLRRLFRKFNILKDGGDPAVLGGKI